MNNEANDYFKSVVNGSEFEFNGAVYVKINFEVAREIRNPSKVDRKATCFSSYDAVYNPRRAYKHR